MFSPACRAVEFPDFVEPAQRAALQGALGPLPNGAAPMGDEVCFSYMELGLWCGDRAATRGQVCYLGDGCRGPSGDDSAAV